MNAEVLHARKRFAKTNAKYKTEFGLEPTSVSESELADVFSMRHAHEARYVPSWGKWLLSDRTRWKPDEKLVVFNWAREVCLIALEEHEAAGPLTTIQRKTLRRQLGAAATVAALLRLASSDPRHAISVDQLDADPWSLNTPGGIVDLRTQKLHPHDPGKLHTKITAVTPGGECPLFRRVLERVVPNPAVRSYLQRFAGYALTGSARDHAVLFGLGSGANGKGTIFHALRRAMGDYALEIGAEVLMEQHNTSHPTELAQFRGARLVIGSEVPAGRRWNESRLKQLTGGDTISARYIAKDTFTFEPTHSLAIIANETPQLRTVDTAIRRRLHMVKFDVTIPEHERDTALPEKLEAEYGGILQWALEGTADWLHEGLNPPAAVLETSQAYFDGEDTLQQWIDDCCQKGGQVTLQAAHKSYREWCDRNGAPVLGRNNFSMQLAARGFPRSNDSRNKTPVFAGLSLPSTPDWNGRE